LKSKKPAQHSLKIFGKRFRRQIPNIPHKLDNLGVGIEDSPEYDAIREALVNLLMHTDYFSPIKPRVRVFTDRIEFENPGGFPRPIKELLKKDVSIPRNPVIAKLFRNVKLADNAGYGFDKMLKWGKSTHTKVDFENSIDVALVTFKIDNVDSPSGQTGGQTSGKTGGKTGGKTLSEAQTNILNLIRENPKISYKEMSEKLDMNTSAIQKHINKLKESGIIQRLGADFGGEWVVN
jgi:ATP-dependent DNA helicase RecG